MATFKIIQATEHHRSVTDQLGPGSFIGLIDFTTGNSSMTTGRVVKKGRAIRIRQDEFEDYLKHHHRMSYPMQQLIHKKRWLRWGSW